MLQPRRVWTIAKAIERKRKQINENVPFSEQTPDFGGQIAVDYMLGLAKVKGMVKGPLDIDRMSGAEIGKTRKVTTA